MRTHPALATNHVLRLPDITLPTEQLLRQRADILARITEREMEFIQWICHPEEYTYKYVAAVMEVSTDRVRDYSRNLFKKFGIRSRSGLVQFAFCWQLLKQPLPQVVTVQTG